MINPARENTPARQNKTRSSHPMSEHINNVTQRKNILKNVIRQLHEGRTVEDVKAEFGGLAGQASSTEIAEIEQMLVDEGMPVEEIQRLCDVHVALYKDGLDDQPAPETIPGHPVHTFRAENQVLERFLDEMQATLQKFQAQPAGPLAQTLRFQLGQLQGIDRHYVRKEHLLFPYLEKKGFQGPSKVMWGIHDQIRSGLKAFARLLDQGPAAALTVNLEDLASTMREMVYKEDKILFPTSLELLDEKAWAAIRAQEEEIGYFLVSPGSQWRPKLNGNGTPDPAALHALEPAAVSVSGALPLETGALSLEQIRLIFCNLPVDITFVDENDTVRFFSQTRERIFERTPAIIGRKVQNCHPPQSLARVQQILDDFRAGRKDSAEFWIQMGGKFIHIRYFAVRDAQAAYRGTVEVTQDVTSIRALEGERRLLS